MPEVIFTGAAGRIEGRYHPARQKSAPIGIVLHPHPQFGGTMNHQIIYQLYYAFVHRNFSVLRFNFRGVGRSQGSFDHGQGELSDAASALDWAQSINPEARRVLEAWALNRKNEFVFYNQDTGKPFVDLKSGFALACKKAGISGVTWHILRHTFASRLLALGVDIVTVQQLLGHSTLMVTMRYLHTNLDSKRAAVEKLAGFSDNLVTVRTKMVQLNSKMSQTAS